MTMAGQQVDVAILGGGVAGGATAYFLARAGLHVCVVDPGVMGGRGASSLTGGIVRAYDPDPVLTQLCARGVRLYNAWEAHGFPGTSPLRRTGCYYFVSDTQADAALRGVQQLTDMDYPVDTLGVQACVTRLPFLRPDHPAPFVLYEPLGGYGNARLTCQQLAGGVQATGSWVLENTGTDIALEASARRWAVRFAHGRVEAEVVVIAAGVASMRYVPDLAACVRTIPLARLHGATVIPLVDECHQTYFVPAGEGAFFCGSPRSLALSVEAAVPAFAGEDLADARRRAEGVVGAEIALTALGGIAGYDLYSQRLRPQVGFLRELPGLFLVTAFSGRGYKCCLALGEAAANAICQALGKGTPYADACGLEGFEPLTVQLSTP
jgi:glycine/D-amino acid oxidase-like deaminating enzyme